MGGFLSFVTPCNLQGSSVLPAKAFPRFVLNAVGILSFFAPSRASTIRRDSRTATALAKEPLTVTQFRASVISTPASPHTNNLSTICCSRGASMPKTALTVHSFPALTASSSLVAPYNLSLAARSRVLMMLRPRPVDILLAARGGVRAQHERSQRPARGRGDVRRECCLGTLRAEHERPQR